MARNLVSVILPREEWIRARNLLTSGCEQSGSEAGSGLSLSPAPAIRFDVPLGRLSHPRVMTTAFTQMDLTSDILTIA